MNTLKPIVAILALSLMAPVMAKSIPHDANALRYGNSPRSGAVHQHSWFDRIQVSGVAHLLYAHSREHTYNHVVGTTASPGAWSDVYANNQHFQMNNVNLFVDASLFKGADAHLNVHYSDQLDLFAGMHRPLLDADSEVGDPEPVDSDLLVTLKHRRTYIDEAYVTYYDKARSPVFVSAGKMFSHFGHVQDPYAPMPSQEQVMIQSLVNAVELGVAMPDWYASAWLYTPDLQVSEDNSLRSSWGARIGYATHQKHWHMGMDASVIGDFRALRNDLLFSLPRSNDLREIGVMTHTGAWNVHLDAGEEALKGFVSYTRLFNTAIDGTWLSVLYAFEDLDLSAQITPMQVSVLSVGASYDLRVFDHASQLSMAYENMRSSRYLWTGKRHWDVEFNTELSSNIEGYVRYDAYTLQDLHGSNLLSAPDGDLDSIDRRGPLLSYWLVGLKAHF